MFTLNCKGRMLVIDKPMVMGIINVTPDSFYAGSRAEEKDILNKAEQMLKDGADIIDIGGQSTRPGSERISKEEELKRVIDPVRKIRNKFPQSFISVDTYYAEVAKQAVDAGADFVNDISAGKMDKDMISTIASLKVPYVLMHMKGTPDQMQKDPAYKDVTKELLDFFIQETDIFKKAGIYDVIIDPGFGFGKTIEHNFELLRNLPVFKILERPILLGVSRKSTIFKTLGVSIEESLNGTTVLNTVGLMNGCNILRVHDVKEASQTVKLFKALERK
jgi:dihydropteroate synthase